MFNNDKEVIKITADKVIINSWTLFLSDIWKDDINTIKNKLIYNVQERFVWDEDTENYINEMINKLNKYNEKGVF